MTIPSTAEGWVATDMHEPPKNTKIDWMTSTGDIVYGGTKQGNLWFLPDGVYCYYRPAFWRISKQEKFK